MPPERLPPTTIDALRGRFDDPSVERAYRDGRFQHDVRDARVVIGSISAVWTALMVFNAASGDVLGASVRLAMLAFAVVVLWRVRDPYDLQRRLVVLQVVFPVVVVGLLAHHGTSSAFVLGWMLSLLFGQSAWAVVPIGPQVLLHAVTCGAFSMLLLQRGEDPVRVLAFVAVCVGPTLALSVLSQTRARRLQAAVWRAEALALEGDRLLASVVHELKTPLAAARMAIGVARANPARTSAMLDRMDARISGLVDLVEALLRFGSLGRGGLQEVEPVDLGALASQVAADVGGLQPEVSVEAVGAGSHSGGAPAAEDRAHRARRERRALRRLARRAHGGRRHRPRGRRRTGRTRGAQGGRVRAARGLPGRSGAPGARDGVGHRASHRGRPRW
ncbi:MAG: HAMP domain-containing histidine kinase [Alphaproteobacteria bacterium]|nr:HAMP domain-containing histidine kinase [Alphaproteobacteria bacterium]